VNSEDHQNRPEVEEGPAPGSFRETASRGYQTDSAEPGLEESASADASRGYQSGSGEPASSTEIPGSGLPDEERIDPFQAFAEVAAKARDEKARREPVVWLPGGDHLDLEPIDESRETGFSADSYRGRGNPQVSVRLRPLDFDRLRRASQLYGVRPTTLARMMVIRGVRAILDAELYRRGELLRDPPGPVTRRRR
jgi:hypothetical protein